MLPSQVRFLRNSLIFRSPVRWLALLGTVAISAHKAPLLCLWATVIEYCILRPYRKHFLQVLPNDAAFTT